MAITRTRNKIQFVQDILSVFESFRHSGKSYLDYLRQSRGGDEFDVRDMIIKPLFRKLGFNEQDFYNEVTIQSGEVDLNIGPDKLQPVITVEAKATNTHDLKIAREQQLFPYMEELRTPIGIVTNGMQFEVWEQKKAKSLLVKLDFARIMADYLQDKLDTLADDDFARILKLMYLKKDIRYIRDEDLYTIPAIDISEPIAFQNLLSDIAKLMEMAKIDVEEQFHIRMAEFKDYEKQRQTFEGWQLQKLQKETKQARQLAHDFHRWTEINNIDLGKNTNSRDKFITETMYILINRILLIRIAEDHQIIPRRISNGAIEDFQQFVGDIKINYNKLLDIAYDTMRGVYEHFFKHDIFDWYIPDSELLLRLLFVFNKYNFAHVNRDILGNLYQKYIDKDERKRLGQFYTPDEVVQYILDAVGYTSNAEIENKILLDPACGSGGFLVPSVNRLIARLRNKNYDPITILNKVRDNIYGFDINPFAAHLTETNLLFQVVDLISDAKKLDPDFKMEQFNVFITDSLRLPEEGQKGKNMSFFENDFLNSVAVQDAEIVKEIKLKRGRFEGGVDFVVGNPPWGGILKREKEKYQSEELKDTFVSAVGKYDIYVLFIETGIKCLKDLGKLGYIVQNRFLRADYGEKLREYILKTCQINRIVDFGDTRVFADATNYPCIIALEKKLVEKEEVIYIEVRRKAEELNPEKVIDLVKAPYKTKAKDFLSVLRFKQTNLKNLSAWTQGQIASQFLLKRLEDVENLGNLCEEIMEGVTFGGKGSDEIYCVNTDMIQQFQLEKSLLKKVLKGRDLKKWRISWNDRFLVYPYDESGKEVDLKKFPHTQRYLKQFQNSLNARILDGKELSDWGKVWYSYWRVRSPQVFEIAKIVSPRLATENSFALDDKADFYLTDSAVAIIPKNLDVKYLLGILNSRLLFFFIKNCSPFVQGRYFSYTRTYLEKLPIKLATNDKEKKIAKEIIKNVDKIIKLEPIVESQHFEGLIGKFKSKFTKYSEIQFVPLSDCSSLKQIQLEKRLGKPNIWREGKRVFLTRNHYLDLANESMAEYIELMLKSMQSNLRGLTKPDILQLIKVPQQEKIVAAILKYNADLKKQKVELEIKRAHIDQTIDNLVYELYAISDDDRDMIEKSLQ